MENLSRPEKALYKASEQAFWLRLGSRLQGNCGVEAAFGLLQNSLSESVYERASSTLLATGCKPKSDSTQ